MGGWMKGWVDEGMDGKPGDLTHWRTPFTLECFQSDQMPAP